MKLMMLLLSLILVSDSIRLKYYEKGRAFCLPLVFSFVLLFLTYAPYDLRFMRAFGLFGGLSFLLYVIRQIKIQCMKKIPYHSILAVLGCGLLEGSRISPMLMKRCDKAYDLYRCYGLSIIVCGGKGNNELMSEALAMKNYLMQKGVDEKDILMEGHSSNTHENLRFASIMSEKQMNIISSDYHLLRISILAQKLHLNVRCYGCRSASYYRSYAYLREYLALMWLFKGRMGLFYFLLFFLM